MDTDFILRVVLRAKDDMGGTLARARAELKAFTDEGDRLERRADTLNRRLDTLNRRMDTFVRRGDDVKKSLGVAGTAADDFERRVSKSIDSQKEEEAETRRISEALVRRADTEKALTDLIRQREEATKSLEQVQTRLTARRIAAAEAADKEAGAEERRAQAATRNEQARMEATQRRQVDEERAGSTRRRVVQEEEQQDEAQIARDERKRRVRKQQIAGDVEDSVRARQEARRAAREQESELTARQRAILEAAQAEQAARNEQIAADRDAQRNAVTDTERVRVKARIRAKSKQDETQAVSANAGAVEKETEVIKENTAEIEKNTDAADRAASRSKRNIAEGANLSRAEQRRRAQEQQDALFADILDEEGLPPIGGGGPGSKPHITLKPARDEVQKFDKEQESAYNRMQSFIDTKVNPAVERLQHKLEFVRHEFEKGNQTAEQFSNQLQSIERGFRAQAGRQGLISGGFSEGIDRASELRNIADRIKSERMTAVRPPADEDKTIDKTKKLENEYQKLTTEYNDYIHSVRAGNEPLEDQAIRFRLMGRDLDNLSRRMRGNRGLQMNLAQASEQAAARARNLSSELRRLGRDTDSTSSKQGGLIGRLSSATSVINRQGESIAALDNRMRGMVVLAVMAFAQQLITVMLSLAGALGSVASSAVFAAGALGGAFAAGAAQALPAIGLIIAALARLKTVMDVVKQSDLVRQQEFQRTNDNQKKTADSADALANAQDGVKTATQGVADAQAGLRDALDRVSEAHTRVADASENLRRVRRDAVFEIRDLIQAERDAELAARGAALSQEEAQDRLRQAVASGDVGGLQRAQLGVLEADQSANSAQNALADARRARRRVGGNVENVESVKQARVELVNARKAADDAADGVDKATQAVGRARDGVTQAERALARAARTNSAALDDQFSGIEKLNFMLQQLTPAERRLYRQIQNIRDVWKQNMAPIVDIITNEFANAVKDAARLLEDPRIIGAARRMARKVADAMSDIRQEFTSDPMIDQFVRIQDQALTNIGPITDIIVQLGHAFANIAEAAGPALHTLIEDFAGLAGDVRNITENQSALTDFFNRGVEHAEAWAQLAIAVGQIAFDFARIGEAQGLQAVRDLAGWVDDLRGRMNANADDVGQFLNDSMDTVKILLHLLGEVGKALFQAFDPDRVQPLAQFIEDALIPALTLAIQTVGLFSSTFFKFMDAVPGGTETVGLLLYVTLIGKVVTSTAGLFANLSQEFTHFASIVNGALQVLGKLRGVDRLLSPLAMLIGGRGVGRFANVTRGGGGAAAGAAEEALMFAGGPAAAARAGKTAAEAAEKGAAQAAGRRGIFASILKPAAATDMATKEGGRLGGVFSGFMKSGLVRTLGLASVGIAAIGAIKTAFQFGSVAAGVRDIGSFISFGIIDSAEEVARNNAHKISDAIGKSIKNIDVPMEKIGAFRTPPRSVRSTNETGLPLGGRGAGGLISVAQQTAQRSQFDIWVDTLPERLQKPARKLVDLRNRLQQLGSDNDLTGVKKLRGVADNLGNKFPELKDGFDEIAGAAEKSAKRIADAFRPLQVGAKTAFDIAVDPKHWKKITDDALTEIGKLPKGMRTKARDSMLAMIDQLERQGRIPADKAAKIRDRVVDKFEDMRRRTRRKTRDLADQNAQNIDALLTASSEGLINLGGNVNEALRALGMKKVDFHVTRWRFNRATNASPGSDRAQGDAGGFYDFARDGMFVSGAGQRGADDRFRRVAPGEAVLPWPVQAVVNSLLPGQETLYSISKRIKGLQGGSISDALGGDAAGRIVPIPWQPGEEIAASILGLVTKLRGKYHFNVTDAFDRDHSAGHKSAGHNVTGTAVDIVPGSGGSWNSVEALGRWAVSKGLTVYYGTNGVGTPLAGHGRGNHMHIEFANASGALARGIAEIANIKAPKLTGQAGALLDMSNAALRRVTRAANQYLDSQTATATAGITENFTGGGNAAKNRALARRMYNSVRGRLGGNFSMLDYIIMHESGYNVHADNPTSDAYGIPQSLPGSKMASAGRDWHDNPATQIKWMLNYIMERYKGLPQAYAFWRSHGNYQLGGAIPGYGGGDTFPARLEPGEHVITKDEVKAAGGHDFFYWLRKQLGGGTQSRNPRGYAEGGQTVSASERRTNMQFTTVFERQRLDAIRRGLYDLPILPLRDWEDLTHEARLVFNSIANAGKRFASRIRSINHEIRQLERGRENDRERAQIASLKQMRGQLQEAAATPRTRAAFRAASRNDAVNRLISEGGVIDQMDQQRERMTAAAERSMIRLRIKFTTIRGKIRNVFERPDNDLRIANRAVDDAGRELDRITGERGFIAAALERLTKRLHSLTRGGVRPREAAEVRDIQTARNNLRDRLATISTDQTNAIQSMLEAKVAQNQAIIDRITRSAEQSTGRLDIQNRLAQAIGDVGWIQRINEQRASVLTNQANQLEARLGAARRLGNDELVQTLTQQIADLRTSVFEMAQQAVTDAQSTINNNTQRRMTRLDLFGRMADAMGAVGLNQGVNVGGETLTRAGVFAQRQAALVDQRGSLQALLARTMADPVTRNNIEAINNLRDQIVELDVTIAENTHAAAQARVEEVNSRAQSSLSTNDLNSQIIRLQGEISGNTDTAKLLSLAQERTQILENQRAGLTRELNDAMSRGDKAEIEDLTNQLLQNQVAVLENTKSINELNGTIVAPQQFSTSAWQMFRQAIFNGMGGLLPQYQIPQAHTGAIVTRSGLVNLEAGEVVIPANGAGGVGSQYTWNNHYHEVNNAPAPMEVVNRGMWQLKNETTQK